MTTTPNEKPSLESLDDVVRNLEGQSIHYVTKPCRDPGGAPHLHEDIATCDRDGAVLWRYLWNTFTSQHSFTPRGGIVEDYTITDHCRAAEQTLDDE